MAHVGGHREDCDQPLCTIEQFAEPRSGCGKEEILDPVHTGGAAANKVIALLHAIDAVEIRLLGRIRMRLGASAASADMLVERFQGFTSEVLMNPVHELVGR